MLLPGCGLLAFGAADFPTSSTFSTFSCKEKEYLIHQCIKMKIFKNFLILFKIILIPGFQTVPIISLS
jgi:hypothetical protein